MVHHQRRGYLCQFGHGLDAHALESALAEQVGITPVNLSVLRNNRAKAVRFTTLSALCEALDCQPGDLFEVTAVAQVGHGLGG